jgi:serine/threonine protein kinase/outer membrane protein assembly factor BamD (BamD/ComL family)
MVGRLISHYKIVEQIGAGGMGVVYKAEDTRLGRQLALKFLPVDASQDQLALERFQREARAASAFNHPAICTIYDIGEFEGRQFIAMELLDGQPLDQLIGGKSLPMRQVIELGIQIADALDAAHAQGILHRDIKPANIFVTRRGVAKVLDFGLAKLAPMHRDTYGGTGGSAPTIAESLLTTGGLAVGTVAYMSPEQARGEDLDVRSDLFSLGVVLHEMATGRQAFQGNTTAVVFDAILNRMPPPAASVNPEVPPELERIIDKAIEKDRDLRYQTAADIRSDLQRLKRARESGSAAYAAAQSASHTPAGVSGSRPVAGAWPSTPGVAPASSAPAGTPAASPAAGSAPAALSPPVSQPTPAPASPPAKKSGAGLGVGLGAVALLILAGGGFVVWRQMHPAEPAATVAAPEPAPLAASQPAAGTAAAAAPVIPAAATPPPADTTPTPAPAAPSAGPVVKPRAAAPATSKEPVAKSTATKPSAPPPASAPKEPDPVPDAVSAASDALRAGNYDQALGLLQGALGEKPASPGAPEANLLIAHIYERQKRLDAATAKYTEVKNRYPTNPVSAEALVRLADLVQQTKDSNRVQTARQYLTDAVTQFPDVAIAPQALSMRAGIEDRENIKVTDATLGRQVPAALVSYRQLSERYPTAGVSELALWKLASFYEDLKRYDLAAEALGTLGTRFPATRYDAWWEAGELYDKRLKDKDKAKDAYSKVPSTSRRYKDAQKKAQQG